MFALAGRSARGTLRSTWITSWPSRLANGPSTAAGAAAKIARPCGSVRSRRRTVAISRWPSKSSWVAATSSKACPTPLVPLRAAAAIRRATSGSDSRSRASTAVSSVALMLREVVSPSARCDPGAELSGDDLTAHLVREILLVPAARAQPWGQRSLRREAARTEERLGCAPHLRVGRSDPQRLDRLEHGRQPSTRLLTSLASCHKPIEVPHDGLYVERAPVDPAAGHSRARGAHGEEPTARRHWARRRSKSSGRAGPAEPRRSGWRPRGARCPTRDPSRRRDAAVPAGRNRRSASSGCILLVTIRSRNRTPAVMAASTGRRAAQCRSSALSLRRRGWWIGGRRPLRRGVGEQISGHGRAAGARLVRAEEIGDRRTDRELRGPLWSTATRRSDSLRETRSARPG